MCVCFLLKDDIASSASPFTTEQSNLRNTLIQNKINTKEREKFAGTHIQTQIHIYEAYMNIYKNIDAYRIHTNALVGL